ncbi:MAG: hypothetical protein Q7O66_03985 [Dehalococcoidia bacterium]|nr:hypothetical protein [Dehalococcoidia bacterium]
MAKSAVGSVIAGGIAAGATYLIYEIGLNGGFGSDVQTQMKAIQKALFPNKSADAFKGSESGGGGGKHDCPFIAGDRYVFQNGSPPAWTVVWRGKSVYTSGVQGFAENKYNDLCASDPY